MGRDYSPGSRRRDYDDGRESRRRETEGSHGSARDKYRSRDLVEDRDRDRRRSRDRDEGRDRARDRDRDGERLDRKRRRRDSYSDESDDDLDGRKGRDKEKSSKK